MKFDAQCDVASIVYKAGDYPDRLLMDFATDLHRSGSRAVGPIQIGHSCQSENPRLSVVNLPAGGIVGLTTELAPSVPGCRLDARRLAVLAKQFASAIEAGANLVIINRFGRLEAEGGGLVNLIAQALDADIPVLIAVSEHRFEAWIRFCSGMSVRLACNRMELDRWWRSVAVNPARRAPPHTSTFCEIAK